MEIKNGNYDLVVSIPNTSRFDVIDSLKSEGLLGSQNIIIAIAVPLSEVEFKNLLSQEEIKHIMRKPLSIVEMEEMLSKFSDKMI